MKETYKEVISKKEMPEDIYGMIETINLAKEQTLEDNPIYAQDLKEIPNAGIYVYNKLNEFIKILEKKSITEESVIYIILKRQLIHLLINNNLGDILSYKYDEEESSVNLPERTENLTFWGKIKEFIRRKIFKVYVTEEFEEKLKEYIDKRDEARKKHRNRVIDRVQDIDKIEMSKEFVKTSALNFLSVTKSESDFNPETFRKEVEEELEKLGMTEIMQEVNEEINKNATLKEKIRTNVDTTKIQIDQTKDNSSTEKDIEI